MLSISAFISFKLLKSYSPLSFYNSFDLYGFRTTILRTLSLHLNTVLFMCRILPLTIVYVPYYVTKNLLFVFF